MSITLTEKAAGEVKKIITDQKLEDGTVLRIGVAGGGCSGFQYSLGFDTQFDPKADSKSDQHGIAVVVCLLYTSPSPRDATLSRMPSSA